MSEIELYAVLTDFKGMNEKDATVILEKYKYIKFDEELIRSANHRIYKANVYIVLKAFVHEGAEFNIGDWWTCQTFITQLSDDEA
jgi:hypothetical protein